MYLIAARLVPRVGDIIRDARAVAGRWGVSTAGASV